MRRSAERRVGVTVGKFNPPHLGHLHLVRTGASQVDTLYVLLCARPDQSIPAETRAEWLSDAAPENVIVLVTPDDLPWTSFPKDRRSR
jgi:HTH-type transcriptional regulator, transcriptional repressor of NAD biosynthesis genes